MTADEIIAWVGPDAFANYAERAWASAAQTGHERVVEDTDTSKADYDLVSKVVEHVCESNGSDEGRIDLVFDLYRKAPAYTWLSQLYVHFSPHADSMTQSYFLKELRKLLAEDDDRLAEPASYLLWCGPFEGDEKEAAEAWAVMISGKEERLLQRLLVASGPVPYTLKRNLYQELLPNEAWHYYIFRSLLHSTFDYFGWIESSDALQVLDQLSISADTEYLDTLREELAGRDE